MQTIFLLSLRALTRGRRPLVIAALLAVPALLAVAYVGSEAHPNGPKFAVQLIDLLFLPVLLPLTALLLAVGIRLSPGLRPSPVPIELILGDHGQRRRFHPGQRLPDRHG